uniref:Dehydrogenase/reductase (SDR family) member 12 n=1 Tax=Eptatretus burgeri TaxID=7764 RepID=A0A8C4QEA5_EPTBU
MVGKTKGKQRRHSSERSGYESAASQFNPGDLDVDVTGLSFLVTGSNSGIGKRTALEIARRGGTVHMVCRNMERADAARTQIIEESKNENVFAHILDLSQPRDIWAFCADFAGRNDHLDVLVNNAGCMVHEHEVTDDGLEKNFATNTLGTYILTSALLPLLKKANKPRVVTVSSAGMLVQKLNVEDLQHERGTFDGTMVYAQNKRQQVVLTEHWARFHPGVHFSVLHPGWADTPAVRVGMPDFHRRMGQRLRTDAQGADTIIWLAISPAVQHQQSGKFFQDRKVVSTHLPMAWTQSSIEDENKLMKALEAMAAMFKPETT